MSHKYNLGQSVVFTPGAGDAIDIASKGKITRLLPKEGKSYQYYVQVTNGPQRRVQEDQLRSTGD